jgi:hypothetical protein
MEELIRQAFLHVQDLRSHVQEGHYDLLGPNGMIILPEVWDTVIEPDWTVTMHMWPMPEPSLPSPPLFSPMELPDKTLQTNARPKVPTKPPRLKVLKLQGKESRLSS